jgi:hypothetical protein
LFDIQDPDLYEYEFPNPNPGTCCQPQNTWKKYPTKHDLAAFHDSTEKTVRRTLAVKATRPLKEKK